MTCIEGLLRARMGPAERELKANLAGLAGIFVRGYLPQTWLFTTESEAVTVHADAQGNIRVLTSSRTALDGEVRIAHDHLLSALQYVSAPPVESYEVTAHTKKGATAWNFLRSRFGL